MSDNNRADDLSVLIRDCLARESKMSEWEQSFMQSISEQLDHSGSISPKQEDILNKIWERIT